jgi:phage terminase Nu1 subunit (DNA packaging protein)
MKNKPEIVGTTRLAKLLGITDRRIQQLVTEGVLEKEGRGRYDLAKTFQRYIQYSVDQVRARQSTGTKLEEETRLLKERADQVAMENDRLRGELIPRGEVRITWEHLVTASRTRLLAIPSQIKTKWPDTDMAMVLGVEEWIRQCLEELKHDGLPERHRQPME